MSKRCLNYLPWGPFDQIGPHMRPGLAQTGTWGEHLVVRSNPLGAIFDQVRAFCSPLGQEEIGDDGFLAEDPSASTPEFTSFDQAAPLDSGWFAPNIAFGPPGPQTIGSGNGAAATPAAAAPDTAGFDAALTARQQLQEAIRAQDCDGVRRVLDMARVNRGRAGTPVYMRWNPLANQACNWLKGKRQKCGPPGCG